MAVVFTSLALRGFKQIVIFLTFGPLSMLGVVYALSGGLVQEALAVSLPVGLLITAVAYLKGAHLEVREGEGRQVLINLDTWKLALLYTAAYSSLVAGVAIGLMPPWALLGLGSIPLAVAVTRGLRRSSGRVSHYVWAVVEAIVTLIAFGLLQVAGYVVGRGGGA